jgi:hypothetical protein
MRKHLVRSVLAFAASGFTLTALALTGATAASASVTTGFDTAFAGYVTGGPYTYRFVQTDVPVAKCRVVPGNNATATIALAADNGRDVAHIEILCGGGHGTVLWSTEAHGHGHFNLSPEVGQVLRISVFRNYSTCRDSFKVTNLTNGTSRTVTVGTECTHAYRHAIVGAFLNTPGSVKPPATTQRLWTFRNTMVTSKNGTKGSLCAPWPVKKFIATTTGTSAGTVLAFPTGLTNNCRNFFVNLKGTS